MGPKRVMWVRRYQGQCRALRPLGHQGYRLHSYNKDQPLCSGYNKTNARNKWYFLCRWKGFGPEEDKWEPAASFIHGYTDTFIKFLKKHPEVNRELSLIKDCVTKEDLQAQEEAPIVAQPI